MRSNNPLIAFGVRPGQSTLLVIVKVLPETVARTRRGVRCTRPSSSDFRLQCGPSTLNTLTRGSNLIVCSLSERPSSYESHFCYRSVRACDITARTCDGCSLFLALELGLFSISADQNHVPCVCDVNDGSDLDTCISRSAQGILRPVPETLVGCLIRVAFCAFQTTERHRRTKRRHIDYLDISRPCGGGSLR